MLVTAVELCFLYKALQFPYMFMSLFSDWFCFFISLTFGSLQCKTTSEKHDLVQSGKSSLTNWPDVKLIPQTNIDTHTQHIYLVVREAGCVTPPSTLTGDLEKGIFRVNRQTFFENL